MQGWDRWGSSLGPWDPQLLAEHIVRAQGQTDTLLLCQEQPQGSPAGALTGAPQNPRTQDWGGTLLGWVSLHISVQLILTPSSTELEWLLAPSSYWMLRDSCENP